MRWGEDPAQRRFGVRKRIALRLAAGPVHEAVWPAGIASIVGRHAGRFKLFGIGQAFIDQGIEFRRNDERRRQSAEGSRAQRRAAAALVTAGTVVPMALEIQTQYPAGKQQRFMLKSGEHLVPEAALAALAALAEQNIPFKVKEKPLTAP